MLVFVFDENVCTKSSSVEGFDPIDRSGVFGKNFQINSYVLTFACTITLDYYRIGDSSYCLMR